MVENFDGTHRAHPGWWVVQDQPEDHPYLWIARMRYSFHAP